MKIETTTDEIEILLEEIISGDLEGNPDEIDQAVFYEAAQRSRHYQALVEVTMERFVTEPRVAILLVFEAGIRVGQGLRQRLEHADGVAQ